jgi:mannosyl-3-phosphoglycerate phosphatase
LKFVDKDGLSALTAGHNGDLDTGAGHGTRIIFSDVDGTLLSERGRAPADWGRIRGSLAGALIVLTSSRTVEELLTVQRFLGLHGPVIAENGAILVLSDEWTDRMPAGSLARPLGVPVRLVHLGSPAVEYRALVAALARDHGVDLETEIDVFTPDLQHPRESRRTIARHALSRTHSMLIRPVAGEPAARERLFTALAAADLTVTNSGRWHVVQRNSSKGHGVRTFAGLAATVLPQPLQIVGVGDRENDVSLLNVASKRFVMRLSNGDVDPMLATTANATILETPGVDGWNEIAAELQTTPDREGVT